jgi:hypothetical protein
VLTDSGIFQGERETVESDHVPSAGRNYSIPGQWQFWAILTESAYATLLGYAARVATRSNGVEAGSLKREEAAPRNPWEIRRADLNIEAVRSIIKQLYVAKRRAYHSGSLCPGITMVGPS